MGLNRGRRRTLARAGLAIIGWGGKITDAIDGTFMEVDYVRVYQAR